MTDREAALVRIAQCLQNRELVVANEQNITEILCSDKSARNLWRKKYGVASPAGMSERKVKGIVRDIQRAMEGKLTGEEDSVVQNLDL